MTQVLLNGLRDKTVPLKLFASAMESLDVRSEPTEAILAEGLTDRDRSTACACAEALCVTSSNPSQTAAKIVELACDGRFDHRDAIAVAAPVGANAGHRATLPDRTHVQHGYLGPS